MLCDLDIFLLVFDRSKQKLFELNSQKDFDSRVVENLCEKNTRQQFICKQFTNADHEKFCVEKYGKESGPDEDE